jgi:hypothetical protein
MSKLTRKLIQYGWCLNLYSNGATSRYMPTMLPQYHRALWKRKRNRRLTTRGKELFKIADVPEQCNGLWKTFQSRMQSRNHRVLKIEVNAYTDADVLYLKFLFLAGQRCFPSSNKELLGKLTAAQIDKNRESFMWPKECSLSCLHDPAICLCPERTKSSSQCHALLLNVPLYEYPQTNLDHSSNTSLHSPHLKFLRTCNVSYARCMPRPSHPPRF